MHKFDHCGIMSKTTGLTLKDNDIRDILRNYDISGLETFRELRRGAAPKCYEIIVSNGRCFLKQYREGGYLDESFVFLKFLLANNYPAIRLFDTIDGKTSLNYHDHTFAIFEYVENSNPNYTITKRRALEIGRYLARLHVLGINYPYTSVYADYDYFYNLFNSKYNTKNDMPANVQKAIDSMKERMEEADLPADMPKSICHVEFLKRHLIFKGQKLYRILDWDIAGRDYMLNDLGTTMTTTINRALDYELLSKIVEGYNTERPLCRLEIKCLYEAITFGIFKNAIWALYGENPSWKNQHVENLMVFIQCKKEDFDRQISNWLNLSR